MKRRFRITITPDKGNGQFSNLIDWVEDKWKVGFFDADVYFRGWNNNSMYVAGIELRQTKQS